MRVNRDYITAIVLIIGAVIGALVLQSGITGLVTLDMTGTICENNGDCTQGLVCCYAGPQALCLNADYCQELARTPVVEGPRNLGGAYAQLWSGLLTLIIVSTIALYLKKRRELGFH